MSDFLNRPDQGAVPTKTENLLVQTLQYYSGKTPETYAKFAVSEMATNQQKGKLGFCYYNAYIGEMVVLTRFRFFVLATVCCVEGMTEKNGEKLKYWSNRVFDTRSQPLAVFLAGIKTPQFQGIYRDIKDSFPQGVGFRSYFVAWSPEHDTLFEVPVSSYAGRGAQMAIAAASDMKKYDNIDLFNLASNDHIWGFVFDATDPKNAFLPVDKEGKPYADKGELFFCPKYECGIVPGTHQLHPQIIAKQKEYKEFLNAKIERAKNFVNKPGEQQAQPQGAFTQPTPAQHPIQKQTSPTWPNQSQTSWATPSTPPPVETAPPDDLPF